MLTFKILEINREFAKNAKNMMRIKVRNKAEVN